MTTLDEAYADAGIAKPKRKVRRPEWTLQTKIKAFVREYCAEDHEFAAHDRSFDATGKQHIFEAERGIRAAWPDTELVLPRRRTFRCELKWGDNKVRDGDEQHKLIFRLSSLGHPTGWASSVTGYMRLAAVMADVQWRLGADARAAALDEWMRREFAAPRVASKSSKPRVQRPTKRALRVGATFHRPK